MARVDGIPPDDTVIVSTLGFGAIVGVDGWLLMTGDGGAEEDFFSSSTIILGGLTKDAIEGGIREGGLTLHTTRFTAYLAIISVNSSVPIAVIALKLVITSMMVFIFSCSVPLLDRTRVIRLKTFSLTSLGI